MIPDELRLRARRLAGAALPEPLVRALRRRRMERYEPRVVTHRYAGLELQILLNDPLGERWYDADWPDLDELPELPILQRHGLAPGARVFDLGAHQCILALVLARIVGESGSVVAVEAGAHNVRTAERNRELNDASNMTILHAAAGDGTTSTLQFVEDLNGRVEDRPNGGRRGVVEVPAVSVDGLAERFGQPDVVVIDVEGFEHRVLAGARKTMAAGKAAFFVEVHVGCGLEQSNGSLADVLSQFPPDRYELLAASEWTEEYVQLEHASDVTRARFFLIGVPARAADGH
jgi:FkbM family methyltransferase